MSNLTKDSKRLCDVYGCQEKGWWCGYDKKTGDVVVCTQHRIIVGDCELLFKQNLPKSEQPKLCMLRFVYADGSTGHCTMGFHNEGCHGYRPDSAGFRVA